ncbi:MAG: bifunctional nuclease family protein [Opitutaceae bacterium]|jgi:bifunctional DNase/RNase|nr:bifunctional nuclease family protein [Opitutaceae bacterium]
MKNDAIEVSVKTVIPTANGCAVFLGAGGKHFVIYVDHFIGSVMQMAIDGVKKERPLTHDLIGHILLGLGAGIERVLINDAKEGTFFARLFLHMENELGKKVLEIDARPSDSIVLAIQHSRPIYVTRAVFDAAEDMTELLEHLLAQIASGENQDDDGDDDGDDDDDDEDDDFLSDFSEEEDDEENDEEDDDDDDDEKDEDNDDDGESGDNDKPGDNKKKYPPKK